MQMSVIICTHNPREDYLRRTLQALKDQTLPKEQWELLVIDNASKETLSEKWDLTWHPHARHIFEPQLGLTNARLRSIKESGYELLVFVDDDNVLFSDYLAECFQIARNWPVLGAWGGQHFPEFEGGTPPEKWKADLWINTLSRDLWSNYYDLRVTPSGAGLCVRKKVALRYAELALSDPLRLKLGRNGSGLNGAEDFDMAFVACDLNLGVGRFISLKLHHLMPKVRTNDDYLLRLNEGYGYSLTILDALRGTKTQLSRIDRIVNLYKGFRIPAMRRRMNVAYDAGRMRAINELNVISKQGSK